MKNFFGDGLLLSTPEAEALYLTVRDLPIVDYHCHLDDSQSVTTAVFPTSESFGWREITTNGAPCVFVAWTKNILRGMQALQKNSANMPRSFQSSAAIRCTIGRKWN